MRKFLSLMLAGVLLSSVSFGQASVLKKNVEPQTTTITKNGVTVEVQNTFKIGTEKNVNLNTQTSSNIRAINTALYSEDFEGDLSAWTTIDSDGDGNNWDLLQGSTEAGVGYGHNSEGTASSESFRNNVGAFTPDNWLVSGAIDLSAAGAGVVMDFWRSALDQDYAGEVFSVYVSTSGASVADFTGDDGAVLIDQETCLDDGWQLKTVSLADYAGEEVYIAFRHHDCTDFYAFLIDDVEVYELYSIDAAITNIAPFVQEECVLAATEDITVTVKNTGVNDITTFDVSYTIDGGDAVTETVTLAIASGASADYTFTTQADLSAAGIHVVEASVALADDENEANNSFAIEGTSADAIITLHITPDAYPAETFYGLLNSEGETVFIGGPAAGNDATPPLAAGVESTIDICVMSDQCYTAVIGDQYGDGGADFSVDLDGESYGAPMAGNAYGSQGQLYSIGGGCAANDMVLTGVLTPIVNGLGDVSILGSLYNLGGETLTSFDVVYSVDGTAAAAYQVTDVEVLTNGRVEFSHDVPYDATVVGSHDLELVISNPNGGEDNDLESNTLEQELLIINEIFPKTVVYEEGTGTWCGWCVRGLVGLNTMHHDITDGSWIGIAVHNSQQSAPDPMTVEAYDAGVGAFISGYPSGVMNRNAGGVDPGLENLQGYYAQHLEIVPEAKVDIPTGTWDGATREMNINLESTFAVDLTDADYNAAVIVVENGVTGSGQGWSQANSYSGGAAGPMVDWDGVDYSTMANPIPAADMVYNHVGRALVGGWNGASGSIPSSVTYNTANAHTFTHFLAPGQDYSEIHLVGIIINNSTGTIVNAVEVKADEVLSDLTGITKTENSNFQIYPNPSTGLVNLVGVEGAKIVVCNMVGEVVYTETNVAAKTTVDLSNLASGNYIVKIVNNNEVSTQKIVLTK